MTLHLDTFELTLPNGVEFTCVLHGNGGRCATPGCDAESVTLDLPHGTIDERCAPCLFHSQIRINAAMRLCRG